MNSKLQVMLSPQNATKQPNSQRKPMPPPWSIYLWPTVFCQANAPRTLQFVHLGTRITRGGPNGERLAGQTMWCERTRKQEAGLLWDWAEVHHGVVAMVDPMGVVTNLRLVDDGGDVLSAPQLALHLSQLVRQLPWQDEVWKAVRQA